MRVILRSGFESSKPDRENCVGHEMETIAKPEKIKFIAAKTRSGKIMRRVLKARAQGYRGRSVHWKNKIRLPKDLSKNGRHARPNFDIKVTYQITSTSHGTADRFRRFHPVFA
jgi:hypothetical protein